MFRHQRSDKLSLLKLYRLISTRVRRLQSKSKLFQQCRVLSKGPFIGIKVNLHIIPVDNNGEETFHRQNASKVFLRHHFFDTRIKEHFSLLIKRLIHILYTFFSNMSTLICFMLINIINFKLIICQVKKI